MRGICIYPYLLLPDSASSQRACYLSINPQKDETLETEKAQYYLPDGSTIEVCEDCCQTIPPVMHWVSRIAFYLLMGNLMQCWVGEGNLKRAELIPGFWLGHWSS